MKRPILIAVIGYIIGIIVGLYFKTSIVLFYIPIIAIYFINKIFNKQQIKKLELLSFKRYLRYIKIYFNLNVAILIIISSIISNTVIIIQNKEYKAISNILEKQEKIDLIGVVVSDKQEKQYYNKYRVETKLNNKKIKLYIAVSKKIELEYGDEIEFSGIYVKPEIQRNYRGFDYSKYLKQLKIYGTVKIDEIKTIRKNQSNKILKIISNQILKKIVLNTNKVLDENISSILLGLILGCNTELDEETQENFKNASMSHILAVSGMHVTYVVLGINLILVKLIGKRKTNILSILILMFYMFITNFSPSVTRAGIMGIIMIFSKIIYKKNDIYTSLSISLIIILIYNPFLIRNLGILLSYGGVTGIIIFNKSILKFLKSIKIKNKIYKYRIRPKIQKCIDKVKEIISISISVQIFIFPIMLYNINTLNPYFLISNLILSIVIGPIVISGFIFIIIVLINEPIAKFFSKLIQIEIQILNFISKIGELPFSKIYIATPTLFSIIVYYLLLISMLFIYHIYSSKNPNKTQIRAKNLIALYKIKFRKNKSKLKKVIICSILIVIVIKFTPKDLKIHFIDVGQGDSTLIVTPHNKTILIDGGGSINSDFDVGESTLVPYILDRGYTKIDFVIISHFDTDHYKGCAKVIEELKVDKVIICKQGKDSENYEEFKRLANEKKIKVIVVKKRR